MYIIASVSSACISERSASKKSSRDNGMQSQYIYKFKRMRKHSDSTDLYPYNANSFSDEPDFSIYNTMWYCMYI